MRKNRKSRWEQVKKHIQLNKRNLLSTKIEEEKNIDNFTKIKNPKDKKSTRTS